MIATPPAVLALLPCEVVHSDSLNRAHLRGVFHIFNGESCPCRMPQSALYLALTGGHGPTPLAVRLVDGEGESSPLFAVDLPPVPFGSPLEVKEIDLDVPEVVFRRAGVYSWQVVCWGEVIHEKRLVVWLAEGPLIRDARREGPAQEV